MDYLQELSFQLIRFLQTFSPSLDGLMSAFSFLGRTEFYLVFIPYIYWAVDPSIGARMLFILVSADFANSVSKVILHQPRPYWFSEVQSLAQEPTYGAPSGHASDSLAFWGYLATRVKKRWVTFLSAILVFLIGLSRLYLGVHFIHDVLFGWLVGGVILWLFVRLEPKFSSWFTKKKLTEQIQIAFAISVSIILVGQGIAWFLAGTVDPIMWSEFASLARSTNYSFSLSGIFFGGLAGYALMKTHARFNVAGTSVVKIARYLTGVIGVMVIFFGLDALFSSLAADETTLGSLLRYMRYASVGMWTTFGAPWFFLRLKLANKNK